MERSGSVGRTLDWGSKDVAGSSLTPGRVTVLCP